MKLFVVVKTNKENINTFLLNIKNIETHRKSFGDEQDLTCDYDEIDICSQYMFNVDSILRDFTKRVDEGFYNVEVYYIYNDNMSEFIKNVDRIEFLKKKDIVYTFRIIYKNKLND